MSIIDSIGNNSFKFTLFKEESTSSSVDKFYDRFQNRGPLIEGSYVHFTIVLSHYLCHSSHLGIISKKKILLHITLLLYLYMCLFA